MWLNYFLGIDTFKSLGMQAYYEILCFKWEYCYFYFVLRHASFFILLLPMPYMLGIYKTHFHCCFVKGL